MTAINVAATVAEAILVLGALAGVFFAVEGVRRSHGRYRLAWMACAVAAVLATVALSAMFVLLLAITVGWLP